MGKSLKSRYKPSNPQKYVGDPNNIICRSSWERKFCHWADLNPDIIKWVSEEVAIPYLSPVDNKVHQYYPDFLIKVKGQNETTQTYLVEIKPEKQTKPPKKTQRVTKSFIYESKTWMINQAKWKAADEFCKDHMIQFKVVTEKELGIKQWH